jgi:hypothetical protein
VSVFTGRLSRKSLPLVVEAITIMATITGNMPNKNILGGSACVLDEYTPLTDRAACAASQKTRIMVMGIALALMFLSVEPLIAMANITNVAIVVSMKTIGIQAGIFSITTRI